MVTLNIAPFCPRPLTKSEFDNNDIYMAAKPGRDDPVEIVGPLRFAQWLLLTFDARCHACVERPRQLTLYHDVVVELDFWTLQHDGSEMFWYIVPEKDLRKGPTGRVFRDATLWAEAAQQTGVPLTFVYEHHILQRGQRIANFFRLLPHAQAAYHLPDRTLIRDRVAEFFAHRPLSMTFEQVERSLCELDKASVRSTLCGFIHEGVITFDHDLPLDDRTLLTWRSSW